MSGTVKGIALAPGISRNGRLYTKEAIAKAAARMQARIADPNGSPIVMRTHHAAGDDSTRIVAQVKKVSLDQAGALHYESDFADTPHAQTIRELAKPKDGKPNLAHVSIWGWWIDDPVTKVMEDGTKVETGDDIEIDAIDFTFSPGVVAATATAETQRHAHAITESVEAEITVTEAGTAEINETGGRYADPGYRNGEKRWPIGTAAETVAAWAHVNSDKHGLTEAQARRVRTRIKSAAKKNGAMIEDSWLLTGQPIGEKLAEYYMDYYGDVEPGTPPATFCFDATNGPIRVSISSYCIDPADLEIVTLAAIKAANDALKAMDPDMDGDIDLPGAPAEDDDNDAGSDQMETKTPASAPLTETATQVAQPEKEAAVAETTAATEGAATATAPATESAPAAPVIDETKLAETIIAVIEAREAAKAKAAEEAANAEKAAAEKAEEDKRKGAESRDGLKDIVRELLAEGGVAAPGRKGYATTESDNGEPSGDELWEKRGQLFLAAARENKNLI